MTPRTPTSRRTPSVAATVSAIRSMRLRGASAIGVEAARALAAHLQQVPDRALLAEARRAARLLDAARPTAVSLHNALGWVLEAVAAEPSDGKVAALRRAEQVAADARLSRAAIARHGAQALGRRSTVLTHCHSSTAVAMLAAAHKAGKVRHVFATETRPFRQGLLTTAALAKARVPCTLIVDSAVEHVLCTQGIDVVVVGADTVASDGSLFNKVGTSGVAALASAHEVPLLSAAGVAKFTSRDPSQVRVEERPASEVVRPKDLAPRVGVLNPVFDRTPPAHIHSYVTEDGPMKPVAAVLRNLPLLPPEEVWG